MKASNIFKQYIWLTDTIYRAGKISLQELNERWMKTEMSGGLPMSRITFNRHRVAIEEIFDLCIECQRKGGYVYYIENLEVLKGNSLQHWMLDALSTGNVLTECSSMKDRILLENIPSGKIHLQTAIRGMKQGRKLQMEYKHFGKHHSYTTIVEPLAIKVFKQRWYLLANNQKYNTPTIYAFDRMIALEETTEPFICPEDFDAQNMLKDCYGVICGTHDKGERIKIRAYAPLMDYLRTLPWHSSQKEVYTTDEYSDFEYYLRPTFDFLQEILSQGDEVEILEPESFRQEVIDALQNTMKRYLK